MGEKFYEYFVAAISFDLLILIFVPKKKVFSEIMLDTMESDTLSLCVCTSCMYVGYLKKKCLRKMCMFKDFLTNML